MGRYILGQPIILSTTARDRVTGNPADPTTLVLTIYAADGTVFEQHDAGQDTSSPASPIDRLAVGQFQMIFKPPVGIFRYKFVTTGDAEGADEGTLYVSTRITDGTYTYDPHTPVGELRLLIDDRDLRQTDGPRSKRSVIFNDDEIGVFLTKARHSTLVGASLALLAIAANRQLLIQRRSISRTSVDYGSLRSDLRALADEYRKQAEASGEVVLSGIAPAEMIVEQAWSDFNARDIARNASLRDPGMQEPI
jgi:hypothetical protein